MVRQPKAGQRHARQSDAEFLQRPAARDRLGYALGEFIEFVVHICPVVWLFGVGLSGRIRPADRPMEF